MNRNPILRYSALAITAVSWAVALLITGPIFAHGNYHEQIEATTRAIEDRPSDAKLYSKRGRLHQLHGEYARALEDYLKARTLDATVDLTNLRIAEVERATGDLQAALKKLDSYLEKHPGAEEAMVERARTYAELGLNAKAIADYTQAIACSPRPTPELYLARSCLQLAAGGQKRAAIISGLDQGIRRLAGAIALELAVVEIESAHGDYAAAGVRADRLIRRYPKAYRWHALRGDLHRSAGDRPAACAAYRRGLDLLNRLPQSRRRTRAAREAIAQLRHKLRETTVTETP